MRSVGPAPAQPVSGLLHPADSPSPIEAIKFRMEQAGLSISDMQPYIGSSNRVYEVMSGKRALSLAMIRRLHAGLHIPADVLIGAVYTRA